MLQDILQVRKDKLEVMLYQIVTSHDVSDRGSANANSRRAGISECQGTLSFGHKRTNLGKTFGMLNLFFITYSMSGSKSARSPT